MTLQCTQNPFCKIMDMKEKINIKKKHPEHLFPKIKSNVE